MILKPNGNDAFPYRQVGPFITDVKISYYESKEQLLRVACLFHLATQRTELTQLCFVNLGVGEINLYFCMFCNFQVFFNSQKKCLLNAVDLVGCCSTMSKFH